MTTTITPVQAVDLCQAIYAPITPGVFSKTWAFGGINVGYALVDGQGNLAGPRRHRCFYTSLDRIPALVCYDRYVVRVC